jgi:hypothetical protein
VSGKAKSPGLHHRQAPDGERYYFRGSSQRHPGSSSRAPYSPFWVTRRGHHQGKLRLRTSLSARRNRSARPTSGFRSFLPATSLSRRAAVEIFWPSMLTVFTREPIVRCRSLLVEPRHWPLVAAVRRHSCRHRQYCRPHSLGNLHAGGDSDVEDRSSTVHFVEQRSTEAVVASQVVRFW